MAIEKFSLREQLLIFLVVATVVGGSYAIFRFAPQHKKINELSATLKANVEKVKNPVIVDEPIEDAEDLQESIDKLEAELANLNGTLDDIEKSLAPVDSQEIVLKISEAARASGVKVVSSVPYIVQKKEELGQPTKKFSKRVARKLAKKAKSAAAIAPVLGVTPKEGELVYKLVNHLQTPRPFQQISLDGNFFNLYEFILALKKMPWQTTIVKLEISTGFQTPPPGLSQPITAKMIIAM